MDKDDNDWVKHCITWEVEGIRHTGRPKKTWWDCVKNDMERSHQLGWSVGGAGVQSPGRPVDFVFGFQGRML